MRYKSENQLELFDFHDSELSYVSYDEKNLVISAQFLNIQKSAEQNPTDYDMEIQEARLTFRAVSELSYEPGRAWTTDADGRSVPVGPEVVYRDEAGEKRVLDALQAGMTVFSFERNDAGRFSVGGTGAEPFFTIEFSCGAVLVEWDEYRKPAWYELNRRHCFNMILDTPDGEERVEICAYLHYEKDPEGDPTEVSVSCNYAGKILVGRGNDPLWIDAFADLQRQLPEGVRLKGCFTCRHGNQCPVGNSPDLLFCTKDAMITCPQDLWQYTEKAEEREKRMRTYASLCKNYVRQSKDCYTYNDFAYLVEV